MRKKIGTLLIVGSLGALCAGLCACKTETKIDEYYKQGNVITVTYDGSGGNILGDDNVTIVDMFNPDKYQADGEGYVHIKLRNPADPERPKPGVDPIKISRRGYQLVGWFQSRELVTVDGSVVDDAGNKLVERDGKYYTVTVNDEGQEVEEKAVPAYTFSDPWDFASNTVDFKKGDERLDMTLYAAWVPQFTFEYYYKPTAESEWTQFGTPEGFDLGDDTRDTVHIPRWSKETGRMEHRYSDNYSFPSVKDMTFKAAYLDEACTQEITESQPFSHEGDIDYENATAIDPVKKIYVEFDKGNYYRIEKASQFAAIGDPTGLYTIYNDLDFGCTIENGELTFPKGSTAWPAGLMTAEFTGRIEGDGGKAITFSNVGARYSVGDREINDTRNATRGGLFGSIGNSAVIKNVTFENTVFDVQVATSSQASLFGMFAGEIGADATVENVTIGGELRLGRINIPRLNLSEGSRFNLIANGNDNRVQTGVIVLKICGRQLYDSDETGVYEFEIDPTEGQTTVDENGFITYENTPNYPVEDKRFQGQYHIVNYQNENGGQENE